MKQIALTKGAFAFVDDEDFDEINQYKWYCTSHGYAARSIFMGKGENPKFVLMHRFLMGSPSECVIDHIDGNRLNNTRSNLRACSTGQNIQNQPPRKGRLYKGVYIVYGEKITRYRAIITLNKRTKSLGTFTSINEAALAYNKAAIQHFGAGAKINHIKFDKGWEYPLTNEW